jgi:hypothetical protein
MDHPKTAEWNRRLKAVCDRVDHALEDTYGHLYSLHPVRARRGETANPESDGLFNVGLDFTAGYGSSLGRGYIVAVEFVTLEKVEEEVRADIVSAALKLFKKELAAEFPERRLDIKQDGRLFKLVGDFNLGMM